MGNMNIAAAWVSEPWLNQVVTKPLHNHVALARNHWFFIEKTKAWVVFLIVTPQTPYKSNTYSLKTKVLGTKKARNIYQKGKRFIRIIHVTSSLEWQHLSLLGLKCTLYHRWTIPLQQTFHTQQNSCRCHWFLQASGLQVKQNNTKMIRKTIT